MGQADPPPSLCGGLFVRRLRGGGSKRVPVSECRPGGKCCYEGEKEKATTRATDLQEGIGRYQMIRGHDRCVVGRGSFSREMRKRE